MTEILDLKIESVSPRSEGYTDYQEFKNNHYIDDDNVGANVFSKLQTLTDDSIISSSDAFKPSNENATYHRITFEDTDQFNQVKELIENASGWDVVTISIITSGEYNTKLGSENSINMYTWR